MGQTLFAAVRVGSKGMEQAPLPAFRVGGGMEDSVLAAPRVCGERMEQALLPALRGSDGGKELALLSTRRVGGGGLEELSEWVARKGGSSLGNN